MIPNQKVLVKWHGSTRKHYESLGYTFTGRFDEFEADVKHLTKASNVYVRFICDYCNGENQIEEKEKYTKYNNLMNRRTKINKDSCRHCGGKKLSEYRLNAPVIKENSFGYNFPILCDEWDYSKNIKSPFDFTTKSGQEVWWICSNGHEWKERIVDRSHLNNGCPFCSSHRVCDDNCLATIFPDIAKEWYPTKNDKLTPYDVASKSNKKVWWLCKNNPTHEWKSAICDRAVGQGCPKCKESKGEKVITKWLESNCVKYKAQFRIYECRNKKPLPFDFAIFDNEDKLILIIEYDGNVHFKPMQIKNRNVAIDNLNITQKHDKIKNYYCIQNNISLIRIPYWEFKNIEYILENILGYFNLNEKYSFDKSLVEDFLVNHLDWTFEKYTNNIK